MSDTKKNTLIVNYLPQSLTDEEFESMFAEIGQIRKCKVVRDRNTGYSYGFGFVEYVNDNDASVAIEMLNGTQLLHKVIKVAYSREGEKIKGANLYVRNLPKHYAAIDLENMFSVYGKIIQCRILTNPETGISKGIGFVLFNTRDQAEVAMNDLNDKIPPGGSSPLKVNFAEEKSKPPPELQQKFVSNSHAVLQNYGDHDNVTGGYNEYSIPSLTSLTPRTTGLRIPRGQAVVRGRGRGGPIRARGSLAQNRYHPLAAATAASIPVVATPTVLGQGYIIYAYNIGPKTTQEELSELFSLYGTISKVDVIWDYQKNMGKGYGFITMPNYEEAARAIECLNGYNFAGKPLQVSFKTPKM